MNIKGTNLSRSSTKHMAFPVCISGNIVCAVTIDQYLIVIHNRFYKRTVTNKSLTVALSLVVLTSLIQATLDALFRAANSTKKLAITFIALSGYAGTVLQITGILNAVLLRNVKQKTRNLFIHQKLTNENNNVDISSHGSDLLPNHHNHKYCCLCIYQLNRQTIYPTKSK